MSERKVGLPTEVMYPYGDDIVKLRDQVAAAAHKELVVGTGEYLMRTSENSVKAIAEGHAKVAWDFADAFMRERAERYEKLCVKATGLESLNGKFNV